MVCNLLSKVINAQKFAKTKHKHQLRKNCKTPYWHHLRQVVQNLQKLGIKNQDVLDAGWLHDTIEDTDTDFDDIEELFGKKTAQIVARVTKDTRTPQKQREKNYLTQLKKASWEAKVVKLCDILANIADLENSGFSKSKKVKQVKDKIQYLKAIKPGIIQNKSKLSGLDKIEKQLHELLIKYKQNTISFTK